MMADGISDVALACLFRGRPASEAAPGDAELGAALRRLHDEGAAAWPAIALPLPAFVASLASSGADSAPAGRAADLYLAHACAAGVRAAIEAFERGHVDQVATFLARRRPSPELVDEVRQVLRDKLLVGRAGSPPKIVEYDGRGALESWVRVIALRAAIDLQRQRGVVADGGPEQEAASPGDPEEGYLKRRYREAFTEALRAAVTSLDAEQRRLLRLHFVDGLTLDQLAAMLGVHRATIARKLAAARTAVKDGAKSRLRAALGATDSEAASLVGLLRSQLELSLPGLLRSQ